MSLKKKKKKKKKRCLIFWTIKDFSTLKQTKLIDFCIKEFEFIGLNVFISDKMFLL